MQLGVQCGTGSLEGSANPEGWCGVGRRLRVGCGGNQPPHAPSSRLRAGGSSAGDGTLQALCKRARWGGYSSVATPWQPPQRTPHPPTPSHRGLQLRGMDQDLSWGHAAEQYEDVLLAAKMQW